jgi:hypothetical protein
MKIERNFEENEYIKEITGKEFQESGALWFVNSILHLFGMAITWNPETDELKASLCRFRGFDSKNNDAGYMKLTQYLKDNIEQIKLDCEE